MRTPPWLDSFIARIEHAPQLDSMLEPMRSLSAHVSGGGHGAFLRGEWLGHAFHPLATDIPLGCWLGSAALDLTTWHRGARASQRLVGLGLLAMPVTAASGLADWGTIDDDRPRRVGVVHAVGNTMVGLLYFRSWRRRRAGHHVAGVVYGLMGGSLAIVTGYLGGHLSFGRPTEVEPRRRSTAASAPHASSSPTVGDLLTLVEAAEALGATVDRVLIMVDEGLLPPAVGGQAMLFRRGDIVAVRMQGG